MVAGGNRGVGQLIDWTLVLRKSLLGLIIEGPGIGLGGLITALLLMPDQPNWLLGFQAGYAGGAIGGCLSHALREIFRQMGLE